MNIHELLNSEKPILLDGSIGALLIREGLGGSVYHRQNIENQNLIVQIHRQYLDAGCDVILTNTFNITPESMQKANLTIEDTVSGAVACAKKAMENYTDRFIALDIGPSGIMLDPVGDGSYNDALQHFKKQIVVAYQDVDLFLIETVSDLTEMRAAVEAIRSYCNKPIFAAMTFTQKARTWMGATLESWADLANELEIDLAGINCTLTPNEMLPLITQFKQMTQKRTFAEPNRGQPVKNGAVTTYKMSAQQFAQEMMDIYHAGITCIGGCCGSDPECMKIISDLIQNESAKGASV